jgi:hypothetical protein
LLAEISIYSTTPPVGGHHLMANTSLTTTPEPAQTLLEQLQTNFDIQPGESNMFVLAMPDIPPQQAPVIVQVQSKQQINSGLFGTIGVCWAQLNPGTIDPKRDVAGGYTLDVRGYADSIFSRGVGMPQSLDLDYENAKVDILQPPKHGTLAQGRYPGNDLSYYPDPNYFGNDKAVFLVNIEGHSIKVVYYIKLVKGNDFSKFADDYKKYCPSPNWWDMSSSTSDVSSFVSGFSQGLINLEQSNVTVTFSDLPGGAVGDTYRNRWNSEAVPMR